MSELKSLPSEPHFERVLNSWEVLALAFGAMIGFSWILLTSDWIVQAGVGGALLAFVIGGFAILFIGLAYSELASAMPFVGGVHVYSYRAMGDLGAFWCTWMLVLGYVAIAAFEAVAFPTVMAELIGNYDLGYLWTVAGWDVYFSWAVVGSIGALLIMWLNIRGIKIAANAQTIVTLVIAIAGAALVLGAIGNGNTENISYVFGEGTSGFFAVLILIPALFVGFDVIPQTAEEINMPAKKIGSVLVLSVLIAVAFYILLVVAVALSLDRDSLTSASMGTVEAARTVLWGNFGGYFLLLAGLAGILTSWNAFLIGGSRAIYALAHSGMLPKWLAKLHPEHKTPVNAIYLIGFLSALAPFFGRPMLLWLLNAGSFAIMFAYLFVALSWLILRRNEPQMNRPYKAGNSNFVGWAAVGMSIFLLALYLPTMPAALTWPNEWAMIVAWVLVGALMYIWCRKNYGLADPKAILHKLDK